MNYHSKMMNIPCSVSTNSDLGLAFASGHRDARHTAAEIAAGADATIARLHDLLDDLVHAVEADNWSNTETAFALHNAQGALKGTNDV